ncbi:MAG TPA: holo-ACP synthase [Gemmatimonadota bacterium]
MIRGVGVDLVEVERVRRALARWGRRFLERIFAPEELEDARRGSDFEASLAARFAAKEAAYKAARQILGRPLALRSIVVSAGRGRAPTIVLADAGEAPPLACWCSLSHAGGLACAVVVIEEDGTAP